MYIITNFQKVRPLTMFTQILKEEGAGALMSGVGPRILWISAGGAVFLGAYEFAKDFLLGIEERAQKGN
jgi:solute carrier family 25 (mitochondrial S-adenosylmethionine transporter), member 26